MVKLAILGAGGRGRTYAQYVLDNPTEAKIVAVAEPNEYCRSLIAKQHDIPSDMLFDTWEEVLDQPKFCDAVMICTQDRMHYEPAMRALELGYDILLEKPISPDLQECINIAKLAEAKGRIVSVCHVLRYTSFFRKIKELLDSGIIGKLISIQHNENVGFWHQAHSFVRGNWRNSIESAPMILAKSCHDMDIMYWLTGAESARLSSFGNLTHFKSENAPIGSPKRCIDGCPHKDECPFNAPRQYLTQFLKGEKTWPVGAITTDLTVDGVTQALKTGPYGRCVYQCDNDVVDHQVVNIEFQNGVTAVFTMCAFTNDCSRTIKLMGTRGKIGGAMHKNIIEITDFMSGDITKIHINADAGNHNGGDPAYMKDFIKSLTDRNNLTSIKNSLHSHIMAFAAEKARVEGKVINLTEEFSFQR